MRIFLDTNILLDYLIKRELFTENATKIIKLSKSNDYTLLVSDLSIINITYICRKSLSKQALYNVLKHIKTFATITDIGTYIIQTAIKMQPDDLEDCVQYLSAKKYEADCIITRDVKGFNYKDIKVFKPEEFLEYINQ